MVERRTGSVLETRPGREETVNLMRAHAIGDLKARNPEGESIGDISDVVIDRDTGCIAYAVLSYGGILGFGEKHFAIPWEAVHASPGEKVAVVDTDKRILDAAHGFSRDRMPREGDWSLIRTPPPAPVTERERSPSEMGTTAGAAAGSTLRREERDIPQPAVQTVAAGWGGEQRAHTPEERAETRPVTTPAPAPGQLSAADLQAYLKGMDYPAGRQDLIDHARKNDAPRDVIAALEQFGDRTYRSAADVSTEFANAR